MSRHTQTFPAAALPGLDVVVVQSRDIFGTEWTVGLTCRAAADTNVEGAHRYFDALCLVEDAHSMEFYSGGEAVAAAQFVSSRSLEDWKEVALQGWRGDVELVRGRYRAFGELDDVGWATFVAACLAGPVDAKDLAVASAAAAAGSQEAGARGPSGQAPSAGVGPLAQTRPFSAADGTFTRRSGERRGDAGPSVRTGAGFVAAPEDWRAFVAAKLAEPDAFVVVEAERGDGYLEAVNAGFLLLQHGDGPPPAYFEARGLSWEAVADALEDFAAGGRRFVDLHMWEQLDHWDVWLGPDFGGALLRRQRRWGSGWDSPAMRPVAGRPG